MLCNVTSIEAKQAKNDNWYVDVVAQPKDDPWADELKYRMWCSETTAMKLQTNLPSTIELRKVRVEVEPFQRIDDGIVGEEVYNYITVVVRQFKGVDVDDASQMVNKLLNNLVNDGKIVPVVADDFVDCTGDTSQFD